MANIYLRLPWYVCAFYRGLEEDNPLTEFQPFVFTEYTHEYVVMANNLRNIPEERLSKLCFSQRGWNNILHGKKPEGGKVIINRKPDEWPTTQEICTLTSGAATELMKAFDYLCIQMPREVWLNRKVFRTNPGYALSFDVAGTLIRMLNQEFYHVFTDWIDQDERHCVQNNIHRTNVEVMERFLVQYNIPILDKTDLDSLRRMRNRWMAKAKKRPNDRVNFNQIWQDHISDDERHRAELYEKKKRAYMKKNK